MAESMGKLVIWFTALSLREKIMVAVAAILAAAIIGVYAITLPLLNAVDGKRADYFTALDRRAAIVSMVTAASAGRPGAANLPAGDMRELVSQSALDAGFALDRADAQGADAASFAMTKAKPAAFMVWLNDWEARGITVQALDMKAGTDGTVAVTATFARRPAS